MRQFSLLTAIVLAVLTLFCSGRARGQTSNRPGAQSLFVHLDRTRIPGRLLWPMPMRADSTVMYNGHADSIATWQVREQLIASLQAAAFDSVPALGRLAVLRQRYASASTPVVQLAVLNYQYGAIKPWAVDSALLLIDSADSTYRDGPNHRESPYADERLFVLAPLQGVAYQATVSFRFDADALLTNRTETLHHYQIDCGDGTGWRPLTVGSPIQTTYATVGQKILRLRGISNLTGDTLYAAATYYVARLTSVPPDLTGTLTTTDLPAQPLPSCYNVGANGQFATSYWYARLGLNNTTGQVRRPIIFVEGVDFGREINYTDNSTNHGELGWDLFTSGGGINQNGKMDYQQLAEMPLLLQSLHDKGYDVVFLDFGWGADLIQKNAMTLVKLLQTLEQQGLDEPATVVGTSMGGLVSRYALAWMEQNNYPHCTRLWTSFDSPQNVNANVPLGMQHMINFFADHLQIADALSGQRRVRAPAAAQMLTYQAWDQSNCYRTQFANLLNSVGVNADHMPERVRRVAIVNGSKLGVNQGFNAGDEIIHYEYNMPGIFNQVFRSNVWSVPNSPNNASGQTIFDGRALNVMSPWNLTCAAAVLGATHLGVWGYLACITALNTNGPYFRGNVSPGFPTEPYDSAPGGWSPFMKGQEGNQFLPSPFGWVQIGRINAVHDNACFIPATSALALKNITAPNGAVSLFFGIQSNFPDPDHLNPSLTPFQAYYAPDANEQHTQLTLGNRNFALMQLSGNGNRLGGERPVNIAGWIPTLPYSAIADGLTIQVPTFNYTDQSFERQIYTVSIQATGKLYVNKQGLNPDAGVSFNSGAFAPSPGTFVTTTGDCGATVTINPGGLFELGTPGATATTGYKAEVQFLSGSVLDVAGGMLVINGYSTLRMRAGSVLILNGTANVFGTGQLVIEPGARIEIHPNAALACTLPR